MRAAAGLVALTAGAILALAVSATVPGINLRLAGVIIMIAGLATLAGPARAAAALRRLTGNRFPAPQRVAPAATAALTDPDDADYVSPDALYPGYLLQDPAVLAAEVLRNGRDG
jgi:hypothetical protein